MMKGNIDDHGIYYIIRHGENHFIIVEIVETVESSVEGIVFNESTKILDLEELKEWAEPLIENAILDGDNFDWFISDRNI